MSKSVRIRRREWTNPEDRAFLSFFGTLLYSLRMEEVRLQSPAFQLRRRIRDSRAKMKPRRLSLPSTATQLAIPDTQSDTLKAVVWAARESGLEPKALPGPSEMLTIDMTKVSDGRVPVYERREP